MTTEKEILEQFEGKTHNLLGNFIAEIKSDNEERLWVRVDNYPTFGKENGVIHLVDEDKIHELKSFLSSYLHIYAQAILTDVLEKVKEITLEIIEHNPNNDEIFSQWDLGYNKALIEVRTLITEELTKLK